MRRLLGGACVAGLLLGGCGSEPVRNPSSESVVHPVPSQKSPPGSGPTQSSVATPDQDGPPDNGEIPRNVGEVPDAVPQREERSAYGNPGSYEVYGQRYEILRDARGFHERGYASWYGKKFHGKRTSSGDSYDMFAMTAAHKTLPIPAYARVTNLSNGKSVVVKINDRGPFHAGRIVDVSYAAAVRLEMLGHGSVPVELDVISPDDVRSVGAAPRPSAPPPTAVMSATPAPVAAGTPRYLQAGLFNDSVKAAAFRDLLTSSKVAPLLMKSESRNGRWIYRVLIGPFGESRQLEAMRTRMTAAQTPTVPVFE